MIYVLICFFFQVPCKDGFYLLLFSSPQTLDVSFIVWHQRLGYPSMSLLSSLSSSLGSSSINFQKFCNSTQLPFVLNHERASIPFLYNTLWWVEAYCFVVSYYLHMIIHVTCGSIQRKET